MLTLVHLPKQRRASRQGATGAGEGSQGSKSWSRSDWPLHRPLVPEERGSGAGSRAPDGSPVADPLHPTTNKLFLTHEFYGRAKKQGDFEFFRVRFRKSPQRSLDLGLVEVSRVLKRAG